MWIEGSGHPNQFQGTVLGSKFHWQILAPDAAMLNGDTVDYALTHNNLAPHTSMTTDWAVPWRPHCLVTYALELDNQLRTFPALPHVPDIGFRPWSTSSSLLGCFLQDGLFDDPPVFSHVDVCLGHEGCFAACPGVQAAFVVLQIGHGCSHWTFDVVPGIGLLSELFVKLLPRWSGGQCISSVCKVWMCCRTTWSAGSMYLWLFWS